jgi:hypothetical protein
VHDALIGMSTWLANALFSVIRSSILCCLEIYPSRTFFIHLMKICFYWINEKLCVSQHNQSFFEHQNLTNENILTFVQKKYNSVNWIHNSKKINTELTFCFL